MVKKGVSPIIATVLLISIVIVLGLIIFLWARGFVTENAQKFGGAVELACEQVQFEAGTYGTAGNKELDVINRGNVAIYGIYVKQRGTGEVLVQKITDSTVGVGESFSVDMLGISTGDELNVVPIILGETSSGRVAHVCDDQFGYAIRV